LTFKRRWLFTACVAGLALPGTHAAAQPIVVPFEPAPWPYIVIRVPVAGGPCEALIFDTGTNTTVLAPALGARVGRTVGHEVDLESLNGSVRAIEGHVRGIGFDGVPAEGSRVAIAASLRGFAGSVAGLYGHNWMTGTDYLIDYGVKRIVMGSAGRLPPPPGGHRSPLTWAAGRPAISATVRAHTVQPFSGRFVLDSGADHVTLFGRAADRLALVPDRETTVIDSGFGTREEPSAKISVDVGGRRRHVMAELRSDLRDREEDGLVPTSFFRSVFVSTADRVVVFDARVPPSNGSERATECDPADRRARNRE